ncbi:MAG: hypothetical protein WC527_05185 [Candidatus Margulisiibacteriota bacterium]
MASIAYELSQHIDEIQVAQDAEHIGSDQWFEYFDADDNGELSESEIQAAVDTSDASPYHPDGAEWALQQMTGPTNPLTYEEYCDNFSGDHNLTDEDFTGTASDTENKSGKGDDSSTGTVVGIIGGVVGLIGVAVAAIFAFGSDSTSSDTTQSTTAESDTEDNSATVTDPEEDEESTLA